MQNADAEWSSSSGTLRGATPQHGHCGGSELLAPDR
jgi:hypothetical protein